VYFLCEIYEFDDAVEGENEGGIIEAANFETILRAAMGIHS
jgi:hypothetical protein